MSITQNDSLEELATETSTGIPLIETATAVSFLDVDASSDEDSRRQGEDDPQPQVVTTPAEQLDTGHDRQAKMLQIMSQIRDDQRRVIELLEQRFNEEPEISEVARRLWDNPCDAWVGSDPESEEPSGSFLGAEFLHSIAPCGSSLVRVDSRWVSEKNLVTARKICKKWSEAPMVSLTPWKEEFLVCGGMTRVGIFDPEKWPKAWKTFPLNAQDSIGNWSDVSFAYPSSFGDPFHYETAGRGTIEGVPKACKPDDGASVDISGITLRFLIDISARIITFPTAAAMLSLGKGSKFRPGSDQEFLAGHIEKWRERPIRDQSYLRAFRIEDHSAPGNREPDFVHYETFMHFMRSFIVSDSQDEWDPWLYTGPQPAFQCNREQVSIQGFYGEVVIQLVERRYSVTLGILPLVKPCGHFALTSVVDGNRDYIPQIWEYSPGYETHVYNRHLPWKRYGIHPAGLYNGLAMFQIQLCSFIEAWEKDWITTIDRIDDMVSVKLDTLEDFALLRKIVIDTKSDDSVSYFKVLQVLGLFSDSVRAAIGSLDILISHAKNRRIVDYWFQKSYPGSKDTQRVLHCNWDTVKRRQRDASAAIIARLERTIGEVKSLREGLFNVQSVTEAQKSRALNKYLMVFTIVTIAFLPPTFVATFFSMDLFHSSTTMATQKSFWAVLAGVTSITYVIAGIGIFGSSIPKERRTILKERRTEWLQTLDIREAVKEQLQRKRKQQQQPNDSEV